MKRYEQHARAEFEAAGWTKNGKFKDKAQQRICAHVLKMLKVFAEEGHSGTSAVYARQMFMRLSDFKPLAPLTGRKSEWMKVGRADKKRKQLAVWQNRRNSEAFSNDGGKTYYLLSDGRNRDKTPRKIYSTAKKPKKARK